MSIFDKNGVHLLDQPKRELVDLSLPIEKAVTIEEAIQIAQQQQDRFDTLVFNARMATLSPIDVLD